ncbi:hypothetical protein [Thalassobellus suaedae]|uniref:Uncharacterized protein n=1 Tax=Thalassobellus suaedae TaxID=3074124 RepID=A0ABY9XR12_9FLAO|nr:hypothetical protein RHP51_13330 [Flavobacteriaceae bacterium HL-DH14]
MKIKFKTLSLLVVLVVSLPVKAFNFKINNDSISIVKNSPKDNLVNRSDITVENVYKNYLKFIDPKGLIPSITSLTEISSMNSVMKMKTGTVETNSVMLNYKSTNGKAVTVMKLANMSNRNVFNGETGFMELSIGSKQPLPDSVIKIYKESAGQTVLNDPPTADAIVEQTEFDGNEVYKVSYTLELFSAKMGVQNFYDINDFKKIASIITSNTNEIKSETINLYKNYTNFNDIILPKDVVSKIKTVGTNEYSNTETQTAMSYDYRFNENFEQYASESLKENIANLESVPSSKTNLTGMATFNAGAIGSIGSMETNISSDSEEIAKSLANIEDLSESEVFKNLNTREQAYQLSLKKKSAQGLNSSGSLSASSVETVQSSGETERISKMDLDSAGKLKYRRSSLYTLMLDDNTREHYNIIKDAFGNTELSEKFNNHNIGPYLIPAHGSGGEKDQSQLIEDYLNQTGVARNIVAKWFNRDEKGIFNMNLIAERGQYNASEIDLKIAQASIRGKALLSDAGRELIGNTFVVIYDYKYTNKEQKAKKRGGFLNSLASVASFVPGADNISTVASAAKLGSDIMGKGYFVRTTSYLYRLVWNDEVAQEFYENLWVDEQSFGEAKKEAFDNSNLFKLEYVGNEVSRNNLQSTIFTSKSNEQLIEIATTKAVDKNIGKLQRTYEEFRVKTPLLSIEPLAAKIGLKEDISNGDKFEVLEQILNEDGTTSYERVAIIKVDSGRIWDNTYMVLMKPIKIKKSNTPFLRGVQKN